MKQPRRSGAGGRGNRAKTPARRRPGIAGRLVRTSVTLCGLLLLCGVGLFAYEASKLPTIRSLEIPPRPPNVSVIDNTGAIIATRGEGGTPVKLKNLPPYLPKAFVAIEDRRFYQHFGVDPIGLLRAAFTNARAGSVVQGGSTLTQQLAKNLFLTPERSLERKLQEAILALWLEAKFSKDQILEIYLNRVYFGSGAYGVDAAAQRYFGKPAAHVTLAEAAILAGLVKAPTRLAPTRNRDAAEERAQIVLSAMAQSGFISDADAARALGVAVAVASPRSEGSGGYIADWVMDQLNDLVGAYDRDLIVDTTVDPILQAEAEQALVHRLAASGTKFGVSQGAVVLLDPQGAVKALVGGRSYAQSQFNRAVTARRQPGSAFKPFVYLAALERGYRPSTMVNDAPLNLRGWNPENSDRKYRGAVSLTEALALSINTVSVRLALEVGPQAVVQTAKRLGILSPLQANASIALGTSEVSPLELAGAYAAFANGGYGVLPYVVKRVRRASDGKVLFERQGSGLGLAIGPEQVSMMNGMLSQTLRIGTGRAGSVGDWPAAGKTGTSQEYRDAWFAGFTSHLVGVVWLGNDDNSPTKRASGANLPVEIWSEVMTAAHRGIPIADLPGLIREPLTAEGPPDMTTVDDGRPIQVQPRAASAEPANPLDFFRRLFR